MNDEIRSAVDERRVFKVWLRNRDARTCEDYRKKRYEMKRKVRQAKKESR